MSKFMSVSFDSQLPLDIKAIALPKAIALKHNSTWLSLSFLIFSEINRGIRGQTFSYLGSLQPLTLPPIKVTSPRF